VETNKFLNLIINQQGIPGKYSGREVTHLGQKDSYNPPVTKFQLKNIT